MTVPPDTEPVERFLARATFRLAQVRAARGAAAGVAVAAIGRCAGLPGPHHPGDAIALFVFALVGGVIGWVVPRSRRVATAYAVERKAPQCRNLLITADELLADQRSDVIAARVYRDASRLADRLALRALFPARDSALALIGCSVLWLAAGTRTSNVALRRVVPAVIRGERPPEVLRIDAVVTPPQYTHRAPQSVRDPARIEALAGSHIHLVIQASAPTLSVETLTNQTTLVAGSADTFTIDLAADADGFIALGPRRDSIDGPRRLIGLSVTPDAAPRVRITAPGRDVHLTDVLSPLDIAIEATDDIGLATLRLRYTKVSGSGERFAFAEGEVPIAVTRAGDHSWTARARWRLDSLQLAPGDMVVYRAVATDARPGAPPAESDSYIAELMAPGGVAAAGFAVDPEQERYAVSQQMVILKSERLLARHSSLPANDYADGAQELAAEQRKVRVEFVFMMGGELEDAAGTSTDMTTLDETAEAEGESDLAAGRQLNQGRIALSTATRAMSRAAALLTTADVPGALVFERQALTQLERAFSHARILLRALSQREQLDLSRRLSGALGDVADDARALAAPERDSRTVALRDVLARVAGIAGTAHRTKDDAARLSNLAEALLRADAADSTLQQVASALTTASGALTRGDDRAAMRTVDGAAAALAATIRSRLPATPLGGARPEANRLDGALVDALRRSARQ